MCYSVSYHPNSLPESWSQKTQQWYFRCVTVWVLIQTASQSPKSENTTMILPLCNSVSSHPNSLPEPWSQKTQQWYYPCVTVWVLIQTASQSPKSENTTILPVCNSASSHPNSLPESWSQKTQRYYPCVTVWVLIQTASQNKWGRRRQKLYNNFGVLWTQIPFTRIADSDQSAQNCKLIRKS